jgi:hypothetical protein
MHAFQLPPFAAEHPHRECPAGPSSRGKARITDRPLTASSTASIKRSIDEELERWGRATLPRLDDHRADIACPVLLTLRGERWVGTTEYLSARQALVATRLRARRGDELTARIALPTGPEIEIVTTVVCTRAARPRAPGGLELSFEALAPGDERWLSELLFVMSGELWKSLRR